MKFLPFYLEEDRPKYSGAISLKQNINYLSEEDTELISNYMTSCALIDEWMYIGPDVFSKSNCIPTETWSDGEYFWEASHIFYVAKHRARLPIDFIMHVKKNIKSSFDPAVLDKEKLLLEYIRILEKINSGDESYYDGSY
jgi:hypothetical protein